MKPNKFHSKYVSLGGRKIREKRNICLVIHPFGFPQRLEMEFATTAARKVVFSSTLIGPFKIVARAQIQWRSLFQIQIGSQGCVARDKNVTGC